MAAKWALEASWRPLGGLLEPLERLGRPRGGFQWIMGGSWMPLGAILGPKKSCLERLLAAPRGIPRQVSAILGAKRLPKVKPKGSQIESNRRRKLKTQNLQKFFFFNEIHLIFTVPGSLLGVKHRYKMGLDCRPAA